MKRKWKIKKLYSLKNCVFFLDPKIKATVRKHLLSNTGDLEKTSKLPAIHTANITSISNNKSEPAIHKVWRIIVN